MSSDFKKVLVKDDRLMVTDSLNYGVFQGGQSVTYVKMPAVSVSNNALNFVVPFPSEQTVLDREVYLQTQTEYLLTFSTVLAGVVNTNTTYDSPLVYGRTLSLRPLPTHQTFQTIISQINNNISTMNVQDVIGALLRCTDALDWERLNMTASQNARLASYTDQVPGASVNTNNLLNSSIGGYDQYQGNKVVPNSSFVNKLQAYSDAGFQNEVGTQAVPYPQPGVQYFKMTVTSVEPLLCQPFIWNKTLCNKAGIYGLQNLQFTMNYGSDAGRALAVPLNVIAGNPTVTNVSQNVLQAELHMKYITPHTTDIMPKRNVVPYLEYPRFITSNLGSVPASTSVADYGMGAKTVPSTASLASQTFTLNQVPDKLLIFVRSTSGSAGAGSIHVPENYLPINGVRIQWNNHTALLANTTQDQLFHISQEAGWNGDYVSWSGVANASYLDGGNQSSRQVPTCGSVLMIDLGKHLELAEPYYAPGSLGTFQIQFNLDVSNYFKFDVVPEIVMIPVNSGIMVNEKGQTSVFTGILTKKDVLDASVQEPLADVHVKRIVGNGMLDGGRAMPTHIVPGMVRRQMESSSGSAMSARLM